MKKIVATFISAHLSENEMESLRAVFEGIDRNSDGFLTSEEFRGYFSRESLGEVEGALAAADLDHNGKLNYNEFLSSCLDDSLLSSEEYLRFVFAAFDLNKDGRIEREELTQILRAYSQEYRCNLQLVEELITENDSNKDGAIDFHEFAAAIKYIQRLS
jgi:Ca2+-binding EF-hand superfamily protein